MKVALLPAGHDPDTFLRAEGAAAFAERVAGARSLLSYVLERTIRGSEATGQRGRANAFARVALMLSKVTDAEEAAVLSREAAVRLGVDATQLWIEAQRLQTSLRRKPPVPVGVATAAAAPPAWERDLLTLLLASAAARGVLLPLLEGEDLAHAALREVAMALRARPDAEGAALLAELPSEAARHTLSALLVADPPPSDTEAIEQFRRRLDRAQRLRRLRAAARDIAERQQASTGTDDTLVDALRDLERESKTVYGYTRAVGLPHPMGPEGSQGVQAHE